MVNDRGGLNGHSVKLVTADDGGDPARHRSQVQEMVERDHVVAFVMNQDPFSGRQSVEYHNQVKVPVIGNEGSAEYFYTSLMHFPPSPLSTPLYQAWMASAAQQLVPEGKTKMAIVTCQEAYSCEDMMAVWAGGYAKQVGFDVVYRGRASVAQPDYTAECLNSQSAGANVLLVVFDGASVNRFVNSCTRQGYRPTIVYVQHTVFPNQLEMPGFEGAVVGAQVFPWFASDTPATAEFQEAYRRYAPNTVPFGASAVGWVAAKLFERAAAGMPEPPTAAAVLEGLWSIKGDNLGGLTYDLTFTRGQPAPKRACWFPVRIRNHKFVAPDGTRIQCR
jgi:ABC-type branched-subunit amino acid transport system substrate-binding protein